MWVGLKLFLVSFILLCSLGHTPGASGQQAANSAPGTAGDEQQLRAAPAFTLPDLRGRQARSSDLHGSVVVLDFWATWCEPCIGEIPLLNKLQKKYAARGVKVIGLAVQSGWPRDIKRFAAKHKMDYLILAGNDDVVSDFDVITFPTTYLIAPGWKIYKKYSGAYPEKSDELERNIELLIDTK